MVATVFGWIFGVIFLLATLVAIGVSVFLDMKQTAKAAGEEAEKSLIELAIQFGAPALAVMVFGLLLLITKNRVCYMLFSFIVFIYAFYAITRLFKVAHFWIAMALAAVMAIGLRGALVGAILVMRPLTILACAVAVLLFWISIGYGKNRRVAILIVMLVIALTATGVALPMAFADTLHPDDRMKKTVSEVKEAVEEAKEAKQSEDSAADSDEEVDVYEFDGVIDTTEELVNETGIVSAAKNAGIDGWTYIVSEGNLHYIWSNDVLYVYDGNVINVKASEVPEDVVVANGNYYYTANNLDLYRNGEFVENHAVKLRRSSDGMGVTYKRLGEEKTLY